jgi:flagellar FliL protein
MAQEDDLELDVDGGVAQKPKSGSKLLIIISVVVLLLGISATATILLTGVLSGDPEDTVGEQTDGDNKTAKKQKKAKGPLNYVPMDPPFVVNFNADTDVRFLQITVEVGTRNPEVVDLVKEHRPAIRNSLVMLFGNQDPDTLNTREGKETLRSESLAEIQKVLTEETGDAGVDSVFFTSFVMQ